jgi:hypothetical protein
MAGAAGVLSVGVVLLCVGAVVWPPSGVRGWGGAVLLGFMSALNAHLAFSDALSRLSPSDAPKAPSDFSPILAMLVLLPAEGSRPGGFADAKLALGLALAAVGFVAFWLTPRRVLASRTVTAAPEAVRALAEARLGSQLRATVRPALGGAKIAISARMTPTRIALWSLFVALLGLVAVAGGAHRPHGSVEVLTQVAAALILFPALGGLASTLRARASSEERTLIDALLAELDAMSPSPPAPDPG